MMRTNTIKIIGIAGLVAIMAPNAGCGTTGTKTVTVDSNGIKTTTTVGADVAAMQAATKNTEATAKMLDNMSKLKESAQIAAMARGDWISDTMKEYIRGENAEANAWRGGFKDVASMTLIGYVLGKSYDASQNQQGGDTYNTNFRDVNSTTSGGGESGGAVTSMVNVAGQQAGGDLIKGNGNIPYYLQDSTVQTAEKQTFGDTSPLDDSGDGSDNEVGFAPF